MINLQTKKHKPEIADDRVVLMAFVAETAVESTELSPALMAVEMAELLLAIVLTEKAKADELIAVVFVVISLSALTLAALILESRSAELC